MDVLLWGFGFLALFFFSSFLFELFRPAGSSGPREVFLQEDGTVTLDAVDYVPYGGIAVEDAVYYEWHGRMGEQVAYLIDPQAPVPIGDLYRLREGNGDILLAHLPRDGWTVTDMQIYLRQGVSLPEPAAEGFSFGELYRIEGDFSEEEWEKICDLTDPSLVRALAAAWLSGEPAELPEGDWDRYRIRLHWAEQPGLYVTFPLNVCRDGDLIFLEKRAFGGDVPLDFFPKKILERK